jgi:hypothetical protein
MKEIKVITLNNADDFLNNLSTMDDLGKTVAKNFDTYLRTHPLQLAKYLKGNGIIDDFQYKEMVNKIRKAVIEKDFV